MKRISSICFGLVAFLMLGLTSCSKDANEDAKGLLKTVPADASVVAVVNLQNFTEALGCDNDGSVIKLNDKVEKGIVDAKIKPEEKTLIRAIANGETGMATNALVYFASARSYLTGLLNEPDKFVKYVETHGFDGHPAKFTEEDGVKMAGKVAVVGNQFWIGLDSRPDPAQLPYYQKLSDKQSYVSAPGAERLLKADEVVSFVGDINGATRIANAPSQMRMVTSLLFDDAAFVAGGAKMSKSDISFEASMLNSDFKNAKFLLPIQKIDTSVVKKLESSADCIFAVGISKELVNKLVSVASGITGSLPKDYSDALSQLDGTIAVRTDTKGNDFVAMIQTNGKDFSSASTILQSMGFSVTRDGNILTLVKGTSAFTGGITPSDAASRLKGAWLGAVVANAPDKGDVAVVRLEGADGGLSLKADLKGGPQMLLDLILK